MAVIAEDVLGGNGPPVAGRDVALQLGDLLLDSLGLLLAVGGHAHVQRHSHWLLPLALPSPSSPSAGQAGTPDPTGPARLAARWSPAGPQRCAAWPPSRCCCLSRKGYTRRSARSRNGRRHQASRSRPRRVQQNLSLAIKPSNTPSG